MEFTVGEFVLIKRTSGKWEEGEIVDVFDGGVRVKIKVTDNFRGMPYYGEPQDGYKIIREDSYNTHLKKMKRFEG